MTVAGAACLAVPAGCPEVRLLDATEARLDEPGLQAWARTESDRATGLNCSRSYRYPYALIASHPEQVGVDIERVEPFDQAFLESIRTPSEPAKPPGRRAPARAFARRF